MIEFNLQIGQYFSPEALSQLISRIRMYVCNFTNGKFTLRGKPLVTIVGESFSFQFAYGISKMLLICLSHYFICVYCLFACGTRTCLCRYEAVGMHVEARTRHLMSFFIAFCLMALSQQPSLNRKMIILLGLLPIKYLKYACG